MYITHVPDSKDQIRIDWDMGSDMAAQLLSDINLVSKRQAPFRVDAEDYKIYWAGTVLRVDIPKASVS